MCEISTTSRQGEEGNGASIPRDNRTKNERLLSERADSSERPFPPLSRVASSADLRKGSLADAMMQQHRSPSSSRRRDLGHERREGEYIWRPVQHWLDSLFCHLANAP